MRMWDIALGVFLFNFVLTMMLGLTDIDGNQLFSDTGVYSPLKTSQWGREHSTKQSAR